MLCEFFAERLFSAFWPDRVIAWVRALSELGQSSVHSGDIVIRSTERFSTGGVSGLDRFV